MPLRKETQEELKAPTDYAKRHGVTQIGHKEVYEADRVERGIQICSESITTWYRGDEEPEPLKGIRMCVDIPDDFLVQIKKEFDPPTPPKAPDVDLRTDYDEMAKVKSGTLYRKGGTIQVWWAPGWGTETWRSDEENAKRNFVDMKERWT